MITGLGEHCAVVSAMASQRYACQQQLANIGGLGQLQQAGLNQIYQNYLLKKSRTREEKIRDMERDLSSWLNRNEKITINL